MRPVFASLACTSLLGLGMACSSFAEEASSKSVDVSIFSHPPTQFAGKLSPHRSPLLSEDGREVKTAEDWAKRRQEILTTWHRLMGAWPPVIEHPKVEILETTHRETFTQHHIRLQIAPDQTGDGYLLIPDGKPPFPAVFVPYYDPETSVGIGKNPLRDFAYQLTKRGFVSLSIGSPG
jgi:hypothetical protein